MTLILAPLAAQLRRWQPAALFAVTALVYAVFAGLSMLDLPVSIGSWRESREPNVALYDTYFVIGPRVDVLGVGMIMGCLAAVTWLQSRFGAMFYPLVTKYLFWIFHIGGTSIATVVPLTMVPLRRYIEYPEYFAVINAISVWSAVISSVALMALIGLLIWSVLRSWKTA